MSIDSISQVCRRMATVLRADDCRIRLLTLSHNSINSESDFQMFIASIVKVTIALVHTDSPLIYRHRIQVCVFWISATTPLMTEQPT